MSAHGIGPVSTVYFTEKLRSQAATEEVRPIHEEIERRVRAILGEFGVPVSCPHTPSAHRRLSI